MIPPFLPDSSETRRHLQTSSISLIFRDTMLRLQLSTWTGKSGPLEMASAARANPLRGDTEQTLRLEWGTSKHLFLLAFHHIILRMVPSNLTPPFKLCHTAHIATLGMTLSFVLVS
jgi:hypothetical protein